MHEVQRREVDVVGQPLGGDGNQTKRTTPGVGPGAANTAPPGRLVLGQIGKGESVAQNAAGAEAPGQRQTVAACKIVVVSTAFDILAPKGQVREGRIQLSGGAANAKYDLHFYRGDKGGFKRVRSAQLPRQMTGRTATFNLKALSGGLDWRIEVCPAGTPAGKAGKTACKTSDFRILQSSSLGKVKAPGPQGEPKTFILPGSGSYGS